MKGSTFLLVLGILYALFQLPLLFAPEPGILIGVSSAAVMLVSQWAFLYAGQWREKGEGLEDSNPSIPIILGLFSAVVMFVSIGSTSISSDMYSIGWSIWPGAIISVVIAAATVAVDQFFFRKHHSVARRARALGLLAANCTVAALVSLYALRNLNQSTDPGYGVSVVLFALAIWGIVVFAMVLWLVPVAITLFTNRRTPK